MKCDTPRRMAFPPVMGEKPEILILGSMPGEESLRQARYYAHPKNAFWPIMGSILGFDPALPYHERLELLKSSHIALWDVLESCVRSGSLDSKIRAEHPNDFIKLFKHAPSIKLIVFNGSTAERLFRKHFKDSLDGGRKFIKAPSTSPAFASIALNAKLLQWRQTLDGNASLT